MSAIKKGAFILTILLLLIGLITNAFISAKGVLNSALKTARVFDFINECEVR